MMRIVVVGGRGDLGARVVRAAASRGHDVVSASRRSGVDIVTGSGLVEALVGADAVVNCADDTSAGDAVTVDGPRHLAGAALAASAVDRPIHVVHVSIVGIDDFPMAYYRRKLAAEQALERSGAAVTVQRATQFHSLAAFFARTLTKGSFALRIGEMAFQPVDTDWVAERLVDVATGPSPAAYQRAVDIAGPDLLPIGDIATLLRGHRGASRPHVVPLPPFGGTLRAFARRQNLPDPSQVVTGGRRFVDWLGDQPAVLAGR